MKQRVISSVVGLGLLAFVFAFLNTYMLNVAMALLSVAAVLELLTAIKCVRFKDATAIAIVFALLIPFAQERSIRLMMPRFIFVLVIVFFIILLRRHEKMRFEQISMVFLISVFVPAFFATGVYTRNQFGAVIGGFYLFWALGAAWLCDTGAYFTGLYFGKHKLAPKISPKKTVEGAVGGMISATLLMLILGYLFTIVAARFFSVKVSVNYVALGLITPVLAVLGMLGDLSASVIKRQFGVKDYGTIMPGHGGVMDRFDSALFTMPSVFIILQYVNVVTLG